VRLSSLIARSACLTDTSLIRGPSTARSLSAVSAARTLLPPRVSAGEENLGGVRPGRFAARPDSARPVPARAPATVPHTCITGFLPTQAAASRPLRPLRGRLALRAFEDPALFGLLCTCDARFSSLAIVRPPARCLPLFGDEPLPTLLQSSVPAVESPNTADLPSNRQPSIPVRAASGRPAFGRPAVG